MMLNPAPKMFKAGRYLGRRFERAGAIKKPVKINQVMYGYISSVNLRSCRKRE
jgi:hypothetical protein